MSDFNKIFGIGLNKTATTSLKTALETLGYKTIHNPAKIKRAIKKRNENKKILHKIDQYDAFCDVPIPSIFKELDKDYPNSKFILTTRNKENWLNSRRKHVMVNRGNPFYKYDWLDINYPGWREEYNSHHKEVINYFEDRKDDILVIDITKGEGWEKICPFLNNDIPNKPFPRKNNSNDLKRKLAYTSGKILTLIGFYRDREHIIQ